LRAIQRSFKPQIAEILTLKIEHFSGGTPLAPELAEAILSGTQASDLTADALIHDAGLPLRWVEQVAGLE